jgi:hypothetical protein
MTRTSAAWLLAILALASCGPKPTFRLTTADNDRTALTSALAKRQVPSSPAPVNSAGKPRAFLVLSGKPPTIVAYDLDATTPLWRTPADLDSRIWVGGDFIVAREGHALVARDQTRGAVRWRVDLPGDFIGAAADRERAYATIHDGARWRLAAFDGASGKELWHADADGKLGAPVAQDGLVYSPYLSQWLGLVDGKTGEQLTRVRAREDEIAIVRATSQVAYYGSKRGLYRLDARSASGTRADSTFGRAVIPAELDRASYGRDTYDPVQVSYSAADRTRVLYAAEPIDTGAFVFASGGYAIHYFRYMLGFTSAGELRWAYSHPRVELVASDDTGAALVAISATGELVALDPKSGARLLSRALSPGGSVIGATFDADGWAPDAHDAQPAQTSAVLSGIVADRDARFDRVKELALVTLAKQPGGEVTKVLIDVLADPRAPQALKDRASDLLVVRADPDSLPVLVAQLAQRTDYIAGTEPQALPQVARSIAGLAGAALAPDRAEAALTALRAHLDAPTTQAPDLVFVIAAMVAIGHGSERPALVSHLWLNHAADELGGDPAWAQAIVHALADHGGPGEREVLRQVAADPRTKPPLASAVRDALAARSD